MIPALVCIDRLGLLVLSQITIERLKCPKAISGIGMGLEISVGTDSNSIALRR